MNRKPLIGVVPLVDYQRESLWMLPGYFDGITQAGGIPVMLPLTSDTAAIDQLVATVDGVLVTGGQDVAPEVYGERDSDAVALVGETSPERDAMEALLIPAVLAANKPVLGICRGIQIINALYGGSLWQDLPTQHPSPVEHHGHAPYERPVHAVDVLPGTPLASCIGVGTHAVNSYHHEAVRDVAPGLEVMAVSEDGLTEAVRDPQARFLWALQWHPEFAFKVDGSSRKIFSAFVEACK